MLAAANSPAALTCVHCAGQVVHVDREAGAALEALFRKVGPRTLRVAQVLVLVEPAVDGRQHRGGSGTPGCARAAQAGDRASATSRAPRSEVSAPPLLCRWAELSAGSAFPGLCRPGSRRLVPSPLVSASRICGCRPCRHCWVSRPRFGAAPRVPTAATFFERRNSKKQERAAGLRRGCDHPLTPRTGTGPAAIPESCTLPLRHSRPPQAGRPPRAAASCERLQAASSRFRGVGRQLG